MCGKRVTYKMHEVHVTHEQFESEEKTVALSLYFEKLINGKKCAYPFNRRYQGTNHFVYFLNTIALISQSSFFFSSYANPHSFPVNTLLI